MPGRLLSLLLAALALPLLAAAPAGAAAGEACAATEVTVVVDFAELGGGSRTVCVEGGGPASQLFHDAGFPTEDSPAPGMNGFVCRVAGKPANGPCTRGDAYWSLWWSPPGDEPEWSYASLGVTSLDLDPGSFLAFVWHEGDGDVTPPGETAPAESAPTAAEVEAAAEDRRDDDGGFPWLLLAGGVVVLGAAAVVPIRRARS
ncbi:hypothetical protein [Nocardioides sp. J54]|uniref:hypothetical protein n=1 Tax=Nocardioides sp. J54 TaxID=935866 RepID=UPI0004B1D315|nr:hypothetical protein [Nocardioides sp. J54]